MENNKGLEYVKLTGPTLTHNREHVPEVRFQIGGNDHGCALSRSLLVKPLTFRARCVLRSLPFILLDRRFATADYSFEMRSNMTDLRDVGTGDAAAARQVERRGQTVRNFSVLAAAVTFLLGVLHAKVGTMQVCFAYGVCQLLTRRGMMHVHDQSGTFRGLVDARIYSVMRHFFKEEN